MTRRETLAITTIVALLALLTGLLDQTDPTPAWIRLPITLLTAAALAYTVWRFTRRR